MAMVKKKPETAKEGKILELKKTGTALYHAVTLLKRHCRQDPKRLPVIPF